MACPVLEEEDTKTGLYLQCSDIAQMTGVEEEEDSKVGLHLLTQQITPRGDVVMPLPIEIKPRRELNDLKGFAKRKSDVKKSRASWRHFCLLLNGVQKILKNRFNISRRVYGNRTNKAASVSKPQEQQLIFPRQLPAAQRRAKRPLKVPRPPERVQPYRKRAMRQPYVFK